MEITINTDFDVAPQIRILQGPSSALLRPSWGSHGGLPPEASSDCKGSSACCGHWGDPEAFEPSRELLGLPAGSWGGQPGASWGLRKQGNRILETRKTPKLGLAGTPTPIRVWGIRKQVVCVLAKRQNRKLGLAEQLKPIEKTQGPKTENWGWQA